MQTTPQPAAAAVPQPSLGKEKPRFNIKLIIIASISLLFFLILSISAGYFFYIRPRQSALKLVSDLLPQVASLKTSVKSVRLSLDNIYLLTAQEPSPNSSQPLETSGVIIHPRISQLMFEADILGLETQVLDYGYVEKNALNINTRVLDVFQALLSKDKRLAGIQTEAENMVVAQSRKLKDETLKTIEYVAKAKQELAGLISLSNSSTSTLSQSVATKVATLQKVNTQVDPYVNEAKKISDYYSSLSDILININIKITSFKNSLASSAALLASTADQSFDINEVNTKITQAQIFLDQAKKDTDEIKQMSETLKNIPFDNLPLGSEEYHAHNIAVLDSVTKYFSGSSTVLQGFITAYQSLIQKANAGTLRPIDGIILNNVISSGVNVIQTTEAQFTSNLQKLVGEEKSLTISFWQNNTIIASGDKVEKEIDDYNAVLNQLKSENKIPYLNN